MYFVIPKGKTVEVYDATTKQRKYTIFTSGIVVGSPSVQGTQLAIYVQESTRIRTDIYDLQSGQRKYSV